MKHKEEIDAFLKEMFYEEWMDNDDYNELIEELFNQTGITKQKLSDSIEVGINNGYSLNSQLNLLRKILDNN